jgi:hypothetical protein
LDDDERTLVLGALLDQITAWVRTQPGVSHLRALLVFDEIYGFVPPHPANPPTKRPIVALMKQAPRGPMTRADLKRLRGLGAVDAP